MQKTRSDEEQTIMSVAAAGNLGIGHCSAKGAKYRLCPSMRLLTACLLSFCFASLQIMNCNMGMAIVCMVNSSHSPNEYGVNQSQQSYNGQLNWSSKVQGSIFGAFNAGLLLMLLSGRLADIVNAKHMLTVSVLLAVGANLFIAVGAQISFWIAILGRFLVGVADALLQPCVNSLLTRWFPPNERSYALGLVTGGRQIGTLLILPTAGLLCAQTEIFGGWPSIFYISALIGVIFVAFWLIFGADKPSKQACITEAEVKFIDVTIFSEQIDEKRKDRKVPWVILLTSAPVWAAIISLICHEFPLITMIMFLPRYLKEVLQYKATENGFLSALPTASLFLCKIGSSYVNSWLQRHTKLKRTTIVKILNSVGSLGLGSFLAATTLLDTSTGAEIAVVLLCLSMASAGFHTPGCQTALVSVAPSFTGTITGITFFFVACSGIANPLLTTWIVQNGTQAEWNLVFYISACVALLPLVVFNLWGSADVQWWAQSSSRTTSTQVKQAEQTIGAVA